jgi:hypothetical protein
MVSFNRINSTLSTYQQRLSTAPLQAAGEQVLGEYNATLTSPLGQSVGQVLGGVESLTTLVDYPGQFGNQIFGAGLTKLTESLEGFAEDLTEDITDAFEAVGGGHASFTDVITSIGAIAAVTGSNPGGTGRNFLWSFLGASSAQAIQNMSGTATGKSLSQTLSVVKAIQSNDIQGFINQAFSQTIGSTIGTVINEFNKKVDLQLGTAIDKVLQAVVDTIDTPIFGAIFALTGDKLNTAEINNVLTLISNNKYAEAILIVSGAAPNVPISTIESTIYRLDTKVSTRIDYTRSTSLPAFDIGSNASAWDFENTNTNPPTTSSITDATGTGARRKPQFKFTRVGGTDELEADFRSATREITETVVHWTGTYIDQDIGAKDVHQWHLERGWSGCGYHYVIRRDGTIERGRPINFEGAHALQNGHNKFSIGVSLVGGYTGLASDGNKTTSTNFVGFEQSQINALDAFLRTFYIVWPGGQVWGHNETDPTNKIDPGIAMATYIKKFSKSNVASRGTSAPLSSVQIASARATGFVGA